MCVLVLVCVRVCVCVLVFVCLLVCVCANQQQTAVPVSRLACVVNISIAVNGDRLLKFISTGPELKIAFAKCRSIIRMFVDLDNE